MTESLKIGTKLDQKYRIDAIIGSGGMGYVYEATNIDLNRKVAVKCLMSEKVQDDDSIDRFHQEAQMAGAIGHDNICEVIDFGMDNSGIYYLVMPLLKGKSLGQMFNHPDPISPAALMDIMGQALKGLDAAHKKKIIHRDIKPDNIYVTRVGDRSNFVKLLDFGISKFMDSETGLQLTRTGITLGTPTYMSPEQAQGTEPVDHRTDIFAMGVVLYEALVGQLPFLCNSYNELLVSIVTSPYPQPRKVNPTVPEALEKVIQKAMQKDPDKRYQSAGEMRRQLQYAYEASLSGALRYYDRHASIPPAKPSGVHLAETQDSIPAGGGQPRSMGSMLALGGVSLVALAILGFLVFWIFFHKDAGDAYVVPLKGTPGVTAESPSTEDAGSAGTSGTAGTPGTAATAAPIGSADFSHTPVVDGEGATGPMASDSKPVKRKHRKKPAAESAESTEAPSNPKPKPANKPGRAIERDPSSIFD